MASPEIISYQANATEFLAVLEDANDATLPSREQFTLESQYRAAEVGEGFKDVSFAIKTAHGIEALIFVHKIHDRMGFNSNGAEIFLITPNKKTLKTAIETLFEIAKANDVSRLSINDPHSDGKLSPLGQDAFNYQATPHVILRAEQDLTLSEEQLFLEIRNSYRSLINKSKDEIEFTYVTAENPDAKLFQDFKAFHIKTAGRQTRSDASWDAQFDMITSGNGELIMGYMDGHGLVASSLFTDYGNSTAYAVAVYDRDLFDKPLAHANVYKGMMRAKSRGQTRFVLGGITPYSPEHKKEYNISKFKKGFCRSLSYFIRWDIAI